MINQAKAVKLIKIYQYVCDKYEEELQYHCQRFTNNQPEFTDQEIMTIYLFSVSEEQRYKCELRVKNNEKPMIKSIKIFV